MRVVVVMFLLIVCPTLIGRSLYRPDELPYITTHWIDEQNIYTIKNSHLEEYPFFCLYNKAYLSQYNLPNEQIVYRNHEDKTVFGATLKHLINHLLSELNAKKTKFTHFTVLQDKDFNYRKSYGLLVLKFNKYPFILKLFLETPAGLAYPFDKGIEPIFFFFMGGGISRHLTGFSRLPNRELVLARLKESPYWSERVDIPRKWFWVPPSSKWMTINGERIGTKKSQRTVIPGTYCIVADAIQASHKFSLRNKADRTTALELCNYLENRIDPHINNFMIEQETGKLIIIDTEHFPTLVGLREKKRFKSYFQWYFFLASKCARDMFFRTKRTRKQDQYYCGPLRTQLLRVISCSSSTNV